MRSTLFALGITIFIASFFMTKSVYGAQDDAPVLTGQEIDARLNALTQSLNLQETGAAYWEYGWGAFNAGTMILSAVEAAQEQNHRDRSADIIQASESLIGLADVIFRPLPAFDIGSVCKEPLITEEDRLQCLTAKEELLERSATRADEPYEALPHIEIFGFNLLAGLLVWRLDNTRNALLTAIPGEVIGEIQLWTTPSQPLMDFDHYKVQFSPMLIQTDQSHGPAAGATFSVKF